MDHLLTRRGFLAASASTVAALAVAGRAAEHVERVAAPTGPVYGRVESPGIGPGTADRPSRGRVVLLDGRVLEATHVASRGIGAGRSVFLAPDAGEAWSVLYAEC
jgi:hypothetical protein